MTPIFFGNSSSPLFGTYHPPTGGGFLNKAVLICSPIVQEYIRSYKAIRDMAKLLSSRGYHVLRFDYSGIGDSAGLFSDATLDDWLEDVTHASNELIDVSGVKKISLLGIRFGGTLAVLSKEKLPVEKTVLWDPILDGKEYVNTMRLLHNEMLKDPMRFNSPRSTTDTYDNELLGYMFNDKTLDSISGLNIDVSGVRIDEIDPNEWANNSEVKSNKKGGDVIFRLKDAGGWVDVQKMEDMLLSSTVVNLILNEF